MERLREGKIYSGTVEGYTSEGQGVVRLDAVVFVPGTIRGRRSTLRITKVMKTAAVELVPALLAGSDGAGVPPVLAAVRLPVPAHVLPGGALGQAPAGGRLRRLGPDVPIEASWGQRSITATRASTRGGPTAHRIFSGSDPQGGAHPPLPHPVGDRRCHGGGGGLDAALPRCRPMTRDHRRAWCAMSASG